MSTAFALQDLSDIVGTGWTTGTLTARASLAKVAIAKSTAQMMCTDAGFHPDQARRHVGEPRFHLAARPLLPQHDCAALIVADDVEDRKSVV